MSRAYGRYLAKAGPLSGPGDVLLQLLNPMTMCLGFRMFGERSSFQVCLSLCLCLVSLCLCPPTPNSPCDGRDRPSRSLLVFCCGIFPHAPLLLALAFHCIRGTITESRHVICAQVPVVQYTRTPKRAFLALVGAR